jgi:hypothetical protein
VPKVAEFGSDVSIQAGKSYISLLRSDKKFGIMQVTTQRFGVGIKVRVSRPRTDLPQRAIGMPW